MNNVSPNNKGVHVKKGFTLVELLVVLVIIGIIVAIALPNTLKAIESANVRETAATLRSIDTAIKLCYSEQRNWANCDEISELTKVGSNQYLEPIPGNDPFGIAYNIVADAQTGVGFVSEKTTHFPSWPNLNPHK